MGAAEVRAALAHVAACGKWARGPLEAAADLRLRLRLPRGLTAGGGSALHTMRAFGALGRHAPSTPMHPSGLGAASSLRAGLYSRALGAAPDWPPACARACVRPSWRSNCGAPGASAPSALEYSADGVRARSSTRAEAERRERCPHDRLLRCCYPSCCSDCVCSLLRGVVFCLVVAAPSSQLFHLGSSWNAAGRKIDDRQPGRCPGDNVGKVSVRSLNSNVLRG